MKIAHKIVLANVFDILLIALTAFFAYQNLNLVLTKLHFVEIADDLNAFFLEARLSEKNYFLYGDKSALSDIRTKLDEALKTVNGEEENIVRATGKQNHQQLDASLHTYLKAIAPPEEGELNRPAMQARVREAGQKLREFSSKITQLERTNVNKIISQSKRGLFTSFCLILLSAIGVSQLIFLRILRSLKRIETTAHFISEGNFNPVATEIARDELGSVTKAINSMAEELRNREELIIQAKKLASIGVLTAGVAHELGNPLNNISMIAQGFQELYDDLEKDERLEYVRRVDEEADRIKEIVKNLLDFSKPKKPNMVVAHINEVVQKSLKLVQNMICICNVEVHSTLDSDLPDLVIDVYQIQEVLINILTNAVQAVSPGDDIYIKTKLSDNGNFVEIEIKDTGKGIPSEYLSNVFDPFFTTKGASGTGLGLFISYGIIKNHNGAIRVKSEVGKGTCFTVELPIPTIEGRGNEQAQNHGD